LPRLRRHAPVERGDAHGHVERAPADEQRRTARAPHELEPDGVLRLVVERRRHVVAEDALEHEPAVRAHGREIASRSNLARAALGRRSHTEVMT
jgi:hypothetical protein